MATIIGSARVDEKGTYSGGAVGDQKQTSNNDRKGEVSMQEFYVHKKGWVILRPKSSKHANKIAKNMKTACNNKNIGYDQGNRFGILKYGVSTEVKTECDCSTLVRECVKEGTGKDPGNFTTYDEVQVLRKTDLFKDPINYDSGVKLYDGDILVTKVKGHTAIVVNGHERVDDSSKDESKKETATNKSDDLNKSQRYVGVVTATALNVRTWSGKEYSKCNFGPLKKNTKISVCDSIEDKHGDKWLYIKHNGKYGFVKSDFVRKV